MNIEDTTEQPASDLGEAIHHAVALRIVLVGDDASLRCYGAVLRRLAIGLIDEVGDLSLLCPRGSSLIGQIPSPPVRLIVETKDCYEAPLRTDITSRRISVAMPQIGLLDQLLPRRRVARLVEAIAPCKPTLLHALSENHAQLVRSLSKQLAIPYALTHMGLSDIRLNVSPRRCAAILCCNSAAARHIRQERPQMARSVHLVPIGAHVSKEACCFAHDNRTPNIICCCPLREGYGQTYLINAVQRLKRIGHTTILTLSGEGPTEHQLRLQVKQLGLAEHVNFLPPMRHFSASGGAYRQILETADLFVQTRPPDTWQPELLEAMSVGAAVVVTGEMPNDLVLDGQTTMVTPFGDEKALTQTMEELLTNRSRARELAQAGQAHLRRHFLASQMIARLARAYRQAAQV